MKQILLLCLALGALSGCCSMQADKSAQRSTAPAAQAAAPRYEHQLEYVSSEGLTAFLQLVEVSEP